MKKRSSKDLRELHDEELNATLLEAKMTLTKLRFQHIVGQLHDTSHLSIIKKDIARMNMILHDRKLQLKLK